MEDADYEAYRSEPVAVRVLGGVQRSFLVETDEHDENLDDFAAAVTTFLALEPSVLTAAAPAIFEYYLEIKRDLGDELDVEISGPEDVLDHVDLGDEPIVSRDDDRVYVSLECECDWEPEHGLQIVFRDGAEVTKVGPYDGHLVAD